MGESLTFRTVADPGFGQEGGQKIFADIAKWSRVSGASQYWPRWALEALAFLTLKYAFSHLFFQNF